MSSILQHVRSYTHFFRLSKSLHLKPLHQTSQFSWISSPRRLTWTTRNLKSLRNRRTKPSHRHSILGQMSGHTDQKVLHIVNQDKHDERVARQLVSTTSFHEASVVTTWAPVLALYSKLMTSTRPSAISKSMGRKIDHALFEPDVLTVGQRMNFGLNLDMVEDFPMQEEDYKRR